MSRSIERSTCYFDGNIVAVGLPSDKFETWCLDQSRFSDETEFWTVTEVFKGERDGWVVVGGCEYAEDGKKWSCSRNRVR